jgi:phage shock protein PspC (stress-responsive transcriptional regulator)
MTNQSTSEQRQFCRSQDNRILGGVSSAIAERLGFDINAIRIAFVVLAVLGGGGALFYVAAWLLIPDQTSDLSIAESFVKNLGWH